jgi:hypothetical protein
LLADWLACSLTDWLARWLTGLRYTHHKHTAPTTLKLDTRYICSVFYTRTRTAVACCDPPF